MYLGLLAFAAVPSRERECQKLAREWAQLLKPKLSDKSWLGYADHARFMLVIHVLAPRKEHDMSLRLMFLVVISRIAKIAKMIINPYQTVRKAIVVSIVHFWNFISVAFSEDHPGIQLSQENAEPLQRDVRLRIADVCKSW